jgi:transposase-like protein
VAEQRKYRKFTASQKLEIVLAGLRGDRTVKDVCREHEITETLYYDAWRDKLLEGGRPRPGRQRRAGRREGPAKADPRAGANPRAKDL